MTQAPSRPLGPFGVPELVGLLFEHARGHLTPAELLHLADGADEHAEAAARRAHDVASGVACLVSTDGPTGAGSFRDAEDVSGLLLHLAESFSTVQALLEFSSMARCEVAYRQRPESEPEGRTP